MTKRKKQRREKSTESLVKSFLKKHYLGDPSESLLLLVFEEVSQFYEACKSDIDSWGNKPDTGADNEAYDARCKTAMVIVQNAHLWWRKGRPAFERASLDIANRMGPMKIVGGKIVRREPERRNLSEQFQHIEHVIESTDQHHLMLIMGVRTLIWT